MPLIFLLHLKLLPPLLRRMSALEQCGASRVGSSEAMGEDSHSRGGNGEGEKDSRGLPAGRQAGEEKQIFLDIATTL